MEECERLEEIQATLDELADRADRGAVILVEGPRDRASLGALGIEGNIVMASQKQLFNLTEKIAHRGADVIIMTDWDERGEEIARSAARFLTANGARPDGDARKKLRGLTRKEIKDVESLHGYVERLRSLCSAKPQHY